MYKLCKTEQSAARQRQLEQGLMDLMKGNRYEDISVSDLCQHLQIPRKAFYRYFSGKDGALNGLLDHTLLEFEGFDSKKKQVRRTMVGDLQRFFEFWQCHEGLLEALDRSDMFGSLIQRSMDYATNESVLPNRLLSPEDIKMRSHVIRFSICGLMTMVIQWYQEDFATGAEDMAGIAARLLGRPLFPDMDKIL